MQGKTNCWDSKLHRKLY